MTRRKILCRAGRVDQEKGMPETGNTLTLETTQGPVVIEMRPDLAPNHVAQIKRLASEKFYDFMMASPFTA
jgi:Cyclophilin type peptidyl-prolyl cis-trans isomerase/CLD